jgi:hypothetical protein
LEGRIFEVSVEHASRSSSGDAAPTIQNEAPSIQIECWRLSRTRMTALLNARSRELSGLAPLAPHPFDGTGVLI